MTTLSPPINPESLRDVLGAIRAGGRNGRGRLDSPLTGLDRITLRLRARDRPDTALNRSEELKQYLHELIWSELVAHHPGRSITDARHALGHELALLKADFATGDLDIQAWSWLYYRFLADEPKRVSELAGELGLTEKSLQRRLDRGLAALARRVRNDQDLAAEAVRRYPGAPACDRIAIDGLAPARPPDHVAAELLAALRDEVRVARLTPDQAIELVNRPAASLTDYRLGRVAEWSQPRYRLDARFVALSLIVDRGEDAAGERWAVRGERYSSLHNLVAEIQAPALVLLGSPGAGKSTLLRRLELDSAIDALRAGTPKDGRERSEAGAGVPAAVAPVTFFIQLNQYRPPAPGAALPSPWAWLRERWSLRFPGLPRLDDFLDAGQLVLLLDALNEMPHAGKADYRKRIGWWKQFLQDVIAVRPGNRVIFSCRSLDYSASLSTAALRVPQVRIEPLADAQVRRYLELYCPATADDLWRELEGSPQLELVRTPYFLRLLAEQAASDPGLPRDRSALFTGFVRRAMLREVERDNPLFLPDGLLTERDYRRVVQAATWRSPHELPERGLLVPGLAKLAFGMQAEAVRGEALQVRAGFDNALGLLDSERAEDILRAGASLGVLEEDAGRDEVLFVHQLLQEYFAARRLAQAPDPELVRSEWRAAALRPDTRALLDLLPPAETLPALDQTGWEETTRLAAVMAADPDAFIRGLMATNLPLAGRAAAHCALRGQDRPMSDALLAELRRALVDRGRDPAADLRARIEAGRALGGIGDPRFERRGGPEGAFLVPPLVNLPGGDYVIGSDAAIAWQGDISTAHRPGHTVRLAPFAIGRFPVTNAEWACFMAAGGYEDERWWPTAAARAWRIGRGTAESRRQSRRRWRRRFAADPTLIDQMQGDGRLTESQAAEWRRRAALDDAAFEQALAGEWPDGPLRQPQAWRDQRFSQPSQPVVGICWYEALAYCLWLAAQTGLAVRLPSEAMWEAAARGPEGRTYPCGEALAGYHANILETRIRATTPVGVFPESDTPEGVADLAGNVWEHTSSAWGATDDPVFGYPYRAADGRERLDAPPDCRRVLRGGGWQDGAVFAQSCYRYPSHPSSRGPDGGFRVAIEY